MTANRHTQHIRQLSRNRPPHSPDCFPFWKLCQYVLDILTHTSWRWWMPRKGNCVANLETSSPSPTIMLPSTSMVNSILEQFGQLPANCSFMVENAHHARSTVLISEHSLVAGVLKGSLALDPVRGNCRRKRRLFPTHPQIDNTPLPKRRKQKIV